MSEKCIVQAKFSVRVGIMPMDDHDLSSFPVASIERYLRAALHKYCVDRSADPGVGEQTPSENKP